MGPELVVSSPQPVKVPLTVLLLWAPAFPSVGRCAPPQPFISKSPEAFSGQPCRLAPHLHVETYKAVGNLETLMSVSERNCYGHTDGGRPSCFLVFIVHLLHKQSWCGACISASPFLSGFSSVAEWSCSHVFQNPAQQDGVQVPRGWSPHVPLVSQWPGPVPLCAAVCRRL